MSDLIQELANFTGSQTFYRHPLFGKYVYTEGIQYLAENAGAYWLIDFIFSNQIDKKIKDQLFQVWILQRKENDSATLRIENGNKELVKRFKIPFTDFPLQTVTLWLVDDTLLLPSEY